MGWHIANIFCVHREKRVKKLLKAEGVGEPCQDNVENVNSYLWNSISYDVLLTELIFNSNFMDSLISQSGLL
jgi:hypothetical protein